MRWSWNIGTFRGIKVYIHATFLLLLGFIFLQPLLKGKDLWEAMASTAFILLLFFCVVLHEFGHALTAQRFGVPTRDITLYPIGGVARLERIPRDPMQELLIAIAGPAVNVVIAILVGVYLWLAGNITGLDRVDLLGGDILNRVMWINVGLVVFNLLPAFPMDGGRVLRALLATRMEYGRATQLAAAVGQAMAMLFGLAGLLIPNPMLLFIAFFVYIGAQQEAAVVQTELAFRGVPVRGAMMTRFFTLQPLNTLSQATGLLLEGPQADFPVLEDDRVVGILTRDGLVQGLSQCGPECTVGQVMRPAPAPVHPEASLEEIFQQMRTEEVQSVPVFEQGRLVGLVTLENIGEFLMIRGAVEQLQRERPGAPGLGEGAPSSRPHWMPSRRARG